VARTAVPGRLSWRVATLAAIRDETATARTLTFDVPDWPGHLPGQHVDVRLTAEDGYSTQRSYSLASSDGVELTVQNVEGGEVSPYLASVLKVGDPIELRGPVGGWFVWRPTDTAPVLLVAGGCGIVPLMAMIRARRAAASRVPFRLIYSARTPEDVIYAEDLRMPVGGLDVHYVFTREAVRRRIGVADVNTHGWPASFEPDCFVCGPTGFVETVADILVALGHQPRKVKTERFG
jgi:ferredoxin-NADP reductase